MRMGWACLAGLVVSAVSAAGMSRAQTPAAPSAPPTIQNSTQVPPAPVKVPRDGGTAGELPMDTPAEEPGSDRTPAASPVPSAPHGKYLAPGTTLQLRLLRTVSTGQQHNGDVLQASLLVPVHVANGQTLPAGTPAQVTVLSAAAAGTIQSYGVLSLQALRVGGVGVYSSVLEFSGREGAKVLPDSAAAKGTDARVSAGTVLRFKVMGAGNQWPPETNGQGPKVHGAGNSPASQGQSAGDASAAPGSSHGYGVSTPAPQPTQPH